ncbi:SDR family oxidoreductase [Planococcus sp. ISL-109]|uniref:SDR family oxidoreductase n=1 Tax=Planococcus sp. ISL-109 TaxID=2819166 RepID=UPI001BEAFF7E|nr:SDR family oxidoreductase [Planococcus sp. ISL-109]MBT2582092.1 SDR family oxidoreductase [Planococcus sp. ISL-109]
MKTLVIGANGKIGQHLVRLMAEHPQHHVKALIRQLEQQPFFDELNAETFVASLEGSVAELQQAMDGCDAVVFTAGSGGSTGADKTLTVDLDGAAKAVEAAELAGIKRFVMVSAIHADDRSQWTKEMTPYYIAKYHADRILQASSLSYTIIRPGLLTDEPANGKIAAAGKLETGSIPRQDVAAVILACLDNPELADKTFELTSGDEEIEKALHNI